MLYPHLIGEGRPESDGGRIVGGTEAAPNSRPYIVTLNIDVLYFCGGTLIGKLYRIFLRAIFGSSCLRLAKVAQFIRSAIPRFPSLLWPLVGRLLNLELK